MHLTFKAKMVLIEYHVVKLGLDPWSRIKDFYRVCVLFHFTDGQAFCDTVQSNPHA